MNPLRAGAFSGCLLFLGILGPSCLGQETTSASLVAEGAELKKLSGGFEFTEGATCAPDGDVFFVDQPRNRIHQWDIQAGELLTFAEPAGRANGMCFNASGTLFACADETNALWAISPDNDIRTVASKFDGKPFNGPNDVWVHPDGSLYFTDPFYKRPWWKHDLPPQDGEHVYRLSADHQVLERVATDLVKPNGIVGTPDGTQLFVADIGARKIYRYTIASDGALTDKRLFCETGSDGMTLDTDGHLYTTSRGVLIFDKTGRHVETIDVPERWAGNVCFGGKDRQTLFITASKGLYAIRMKTEGANPGK